MATTKDKKDKEDKIIEGSISEIVESIRNVNEVVSLLRQRDSLHYNFLQTSKESLKKKIKIIENKEKDIHDKIKTFNESTAQLKEKIEKHISRDIATRKVLNKFVVENVSLKKRIVFLEQQADSQDQRLKKLEEKYKSLNDIQE